MVRDIITCRSCGNQYCVTGGAGLYPCPACGEMHACMPADTEKGEELQRATRLRLEGEFTAAQQCYDQALAGGRESFEALWGRLLCLYGVSFVEDPKTGGSFPVVRIPRRKPLQEQADFRRALELAPDGVRQRFQQDAQRIDRARARILRLSEECPPYDVFVCHKTTPIGAQGYTEDYARAASLTRSLEQRGYRVFFAPFVMEKDAAGESWEAHIYHAIRTSKVMLLICSEEAHILSTFVQSEWRRFLERMDEEGGCCLLPLRYGSLPAEKLPEEFARRCIEAVSMEGFSAQEIILGVLEKYCGERRAPQEPTPVAHDQPAAVRPAANVIRPVRIQPSSGVVINQMGYGRLASLAPARRPEEGEKPEKP